MSPPETRIVSRAHVALCILPKACLAIASASITLAAGLHACGRSNDSEDAGATPTASPIPTKTAAAAPTPEATPAETRASGFWVASSSLRVITRYDVNGVIKTPILDLKAVLGAEGGITALTFLDATNLLVFFDPGVAGKDEAVALVDAKKGVVKTKTWFTDSAKLSQVSSHSIVTGFIANTVLVPNGKEVLRVYYDTALNPAATASVWLTGTTLSDCPFTSIENLEVVNQGGKKYLFLLGATATDTRLNVIALSAGAPACLHSLVTTASGQPTGTGDLPVNVLRMNDGRIYVLYQNATKSKIVSYAFDGTTLSGGKLVFADQDILGSAPRGLAARSSLRLVVGNTGDDKICEVTTAGAFSGFCVDNSFTQDVSAIVSE